MRFIDRTKIIIASGNGGDGCASFRREKFIPFGGPSGGDGGDGGDVRFIADENINTLLHFRGRRNYKAQNGGPGEGMHRHGKNGDDIILRVPIGTIIKNTETEEVMADLDEHEKEVCLAKGGRGGLGNLHFKTATNQAPRKFTSGKEGFEIELTLELKLIADIGLLGLPNAGKSTLISSISEAKPKIADYPFTTLVPNLGVVSMGEKSWVVADIPGLIENASDGRGLGVQFLKHIERTKALVHLVDCASALDEFEAYENYITIREELAKFNPDLLNKKEIICLSKIDCLEPQEVANFQHYFETQLDKKVLPISGVSHTNIDQLKSLMSKIVS